MHNWQKLKSDPKMWNRYLTREKMIRGIRDFFYTRSYHEVETPLLVPSVIPEPYLEIFSTLLLNRTRKAKRMYLTASPEASLKKLLVAGIGNCFEITKSFRNSETDSFTHNPEFSILEWYQLDADYMVVMDECESLIRHVASAINKRDIVYQGKTYDMSNAFMRMKVSDAFEKYSQITLDSITNKAGKNEKEIFDISLFAPFAEKKGYKIETNTTWEQLFNQIFLNEVEPRLAEYTKPLFLYDYPKPMGALAKTSEADFRFAERFELYIAGIELGDCYSELTDPKEQEERFNQGMKDIDSLHKQPVVADQEFLEALKIGLPKCSGMAMGIDRLVMLFTDTTQIQDVIFFPIEEIV